MAILVTCVALLGAGGAVYTLFGGGSGAAKAGAALAVPGCTAKAATAKLLANAHGKLVRTGGKPFDAVVALRGYGFVTLSTSLGVLTTGRVPQLVGTVPVRGAHGVALTHDQNYLLVAGQSGLTVFRVSDLEHKRPARAGTLTGPGGGAAGVAVSPDDNFAFVTFPASSQVAVFNLRRALKSGFGPTDLRGLIRVAAAPAGIAASPNGTYVYVASGLARKALGHLTVINMLNAEKTPRASVRKVVKAGCGPDQVVVSKDNQDVWVTVNGGNALVAYSASKLVSDPQHALVSRVSIGQRPQGLVFFDHGKRLLVADSNSGQVPGGSTLSLVSVPAAMAGKPALLGTISSGAAPQRIALYPGGQMLLVTDAGSGQLQVIKVSRLP